MHFHCVTGPVSPRVTRSVTRDTCHAVTETGWIVLAVNNVGVVLNIEGWAGYCVINLSASWFSERQSIVIITNYVPNILFIVVRNWRWNIYSNARINIQENLHFRKFTQSDLITDHFTINAFIVLLRYFNRAWKITVIAQLLHSLGLNLELVSRKIIFYDKLDIRF